MTGPGPLYVLVVDDDEVDRMAVGRLLRAAGIDARVDEEPHGARAVERLAEHAYDLVVVDYDMPGIDGVELVREIRAAGIPTPIIAVTGHGSEDVAVELMQAGAADYVRKDSLTADRLARRVRYAVRVARAEAQRERAARLRDDVIAIVSHDLRSPLNAVAIAAEELADGDLDPDERARYGAAIRRSLDRCNQLIADLLDVSRIDGGGLEVSPASVSAARLAAQAREDHAVVAEGEGIALVVDPPADDLRAVADRDRILQALSNLISNALRHTPRGGTVEIAARPDGDDRVRFEVRDTGPGVSPGDIPHLFERFWQAKPTRRSGAGLGLAIVKGIVAAHGGTTGVENRPGGGACFYFTLPRPT